MALVVTSYSTGVDFGTSTTDKTWAATDTNPANDSITSYRDLTIPAGVTMTLGLRSILKISGTLTVAGKILGSQTGAGAGQGSNGTGVWWFKRQNSSGGETTRNVGDGGGGGGHLQAGAWVKDVNNEMGNFGANQTAGGSAYNNVSSLTAQNGFSAMLQAGSKGGTGKVYSGGDQATGGTGVAGFGGGCFKIMAKEVIVNNGGRITACGESGYSGNGSSGANAGGGGGGGSGGTVWIIAGRLQGQTGGKIDADGGSGGSGGVGDQGTNGVGGGGGSAGFVRLDVGLFGSIVPSTTSISYVSSGLFSQNVSTSTNSYQTTGNLITAVDDTTGPTIGTPVLSFPNGAGQYQNQIVTVSISDSQTSVNTPSVSFQTVSGINSGTVSTSFSGGTATFTVSNQTGSGTARLIISATDQAGNSTSVNSSAWTIDNTAPQNYVPFFGSGTTDWILDGRTPPAGLTLSGTTYTITAASDPTQSYSYELKNLTIASTYYLLWRGSLTLKINGTSTINGTLGYGNYRSSTGPTGAVYGTINGGGGGNGGDGGGNNSTGGSGYGFTSAGVWTTVTNGGGGGGPNAGGGGGHAYRIPSATADRTAAISNGVSVGAGGGGGGGWNRGGGQASAGGGGLILYAQTLTGTGIVDVCGSAGKAGDRYDSSSSNPGPWESGGGGGGGGGGHIIALIGTNNSTTLRFAAHGGAGGDYAWNHGYPTSSGLGVSGTSGYIQYYYSSGSTPLFALGPTSGAITTSATTFTLDSTIPATVSDNQPAATSALLTSSFRKNNASQTITIVYSKQMTNSEVKITITGEQSVAQTTMTAGTNNTYTYTHVNTTGNGVVNYSIVGKDLLLNPAQTISGSWILDNTAPATTSSIAPSRAYFFPGENITYSVAVTESNNLLTTPSMVINKGTGYAGPDPSAATLSLSSFDGTSVYGYQSSVQLPFGVGSINASVTATDVSENSTTTANLSPIKIIPPSGSFSY